MLKSLSTISNFCLTGTQSSILHIGILCIVPCTVTSRNSIPHALDGLWSLFGLNQQRNSHLRWRLPDDRLYQKMKKPDHGGSPSGLCSWCGQRQAIHILPTLQVSPQKQKTWLCTIHFASQPIRVSVTCKAGLIYDLALGSNSHPKCIGKGLTQVLLKDLSTLFPII